MSLANNFWVFADDFKKQTGLTAHYNQELYAHSVNARLAEMNRQWLEKIYSRLPEPKA